MASQQFVLRLDEELHARFVRICKARCLSFNDVVTDLIMSQVNATDKTQFGRTVRLTSVHYATLTILAGAGRPVTIADMAYILQISRGTVRARLQNLLSLRMLDISGGAKTGGQSADLYRVTPEGYAALIEDRRSSPRERAEFRLLSKGIDRDVARQALDVVERFTEIENRTTHDFSDENVDFHLRATLDDQKEASQAEARSEHPE